MQVPLIPSWYLWKEYDEFRKGLLGYSSTSGLSGIACGSYLFAFREDANP